MSDQIRTVVVLSDTHCGSQWGLCPKGMEKDDGSYYPDNKVRRWIWNKWTDATEKWLPKYLGDDPWALVLNGDLVEGCHHRTVEILSPEPAEHSRIAVRALSPMAERADRLYVVRGTEVHVRGMENNIAAQLGAELDPDTSMPVFESLWLGVHGCLCHFQHHISASMREHTGGSQPHIQLAMERAEAGRHGHPIPQVIVRSHRHKFHAGFDSGGCVVVTPPWQVATRFARKVTNSQITPLGLVVLDWRGKAKGDCPHVEPRIYTPRPDPVMRV